MPLNLFQPQPRQARRALHSSCTKVISPLILLRHTPFDLYLSHREIHFVSLRNIQSPTHSSHVLVGPILSDNCSKIH